MNRTKWEQNLTTCQY